MSAVGDYPEPALPDGGILFQGHADGIKRIAVAEDNQRVGGDGGEAIGREAHVIAISGEFCRLGKDGTDLIVAERVASAHQLPLFFRVRSGAVSLHDLARLFGIVLTGADQNQLYDALRLLGSHVQQRLSAAAHANGFELLHSQLIKQREGVERSLPVSVFAGGIGGLSVSAEIGQDEAVAFEPVVFQELH